MSSDEIQMLLRRRNIATMAELKEALGTEVDVTVFRKTPRAPPIAPANRTGEMSPGRMTYDLWRLRLHGIIERIPGTHRYRHTDLGVRVALFFTLSYARLLRLAFTDLLVPPPHADSAFQQAFRRFQRTFDSYHSGAKLAA